MRYTAVIWPKREPWPFSRGHEIEIAGPGFDSAAGAVQWGAELDRLVRAPRNLPLRILIVAVDEEGRLTDGPWSPELAPADPRAAGWYVQRSDNSATVERADRWDGNGPPAGWAEYHGPRPPGPTAIIEPGEARSGRAGIVKKNASRVVSYDGKTGPACEQALPRSAWIELAALQAVMVHLEAGPRASGPSDRSADPGAVEWIEACQ